MLFNVNVKNKIDDGFFEIKRCAEKTANKKLSFVFLYLLIKKTKIEIEFSRFQCVLKSETKKTKYFIWKIKPFNATSNGKKSLFSLFYIQIYFFHRTAIVKLFKISKMMQNRPHVQLTNIYLREFLMENTKL